MILAGGEGRRLGPLTPDRAKPAVPFGGRYRIIDIVLSNFVNSGLRRIKILTQYKSASLDEHLARAWHLADARQLHRDHPGAAAHRQELVQGLGRRRLPDPARHHRRVARATSASSAATTSTRWTCGRCCSSTSPPTPRSPSPPSRSSAPRRAPVRRHRERRSTAGSRPSTRRSQDPPPMPGQPGHVPRLDGQLHLQDQRAARRARARRHAARPAPTTSARDIIPAMVEGGSRVSVYDFAQEPRPRRGRGRRATGATSAPSRPTGRRRWTSSASSRPSTSTTTAGRSAPGTATIRRPSSCSATRRTPASASPPRAWSRSAASSPAAASTAASSRAGCA